MDKSQHQYITELRRENAALQRKLHQAELERDKAATAEQQMSYRFEQEHHALEECAAKLKVADTQLSLAKREIKVLQKYSANKSGSDATTKPKGTAQRNGNVGTKSIMMSDNMKLAQNTSVDVEMRLQCALEQIYELQKQNAELEEKHQQKHSSEESEHEKYDKNYVDGAGSSSARSMSSSAGATTTTNVAWFKREMKKMEAQRAEFIAVIRKQNKLIDVLKRQKLHLEAAKLLDIAEADFVAALETS